LKTCFELSSNFGSFQEFKQFMGFSCKDYNVVRFDLTGSREVRVFNPGVCNKFKICFEMDANRREFTEENLDQCKDYLLGR